MQEVIRLQHGFNFLSLIQWLYQYRTTRWMLLCAMQVYEHMPQASRIMLEVYQVLFQPENVIFEKPVISWL